MSQPPSTASSRRRSATSCATPARRTVGVTAAIIGGQLLVTVEDDGQGFGPGSVGHGIEGMIERARMVAGRLELERPAGGGARIRFETTIGAT